MVELALPCGDQRPQKPPRRRRPFGRALVDMASPRRGMEAARGEAHCNADHSSASSSDLSVFFFAAFGSGFQFTFVTPANLGLQTAIRRWHSVNNSDSSGTLNATR